MRSCLVAYRHFLPRPTGEVAVIRGGGGRPRASRSVAFPLLYPLPYDGGGGEERGEDMVFAGLNYLAIILAALAAFGWGAIYYMTLSKQWLAAVGISREQMQSRSAAPFVLSFIALIVMSWV